MEKQYMIWGHQDGKNIWLEDSKTDKMFDLNDSGMDQIWLEGSKMEKNIWLKDSTMRKLHDLRTPRQKKYMSWGLQDGKNTELYDLKTPRWKNIWLQASKTEKLYDLRTPRQKNFRTAKKKMKMAYWLQATRINMFGAITLINEDGKCLKLWAPKGNPSWQFQEMQKWHCTPCSHFNLSFNSQCRYELIIKHWFRYMYMYVPTTFISTHAMKKNSYIIIILL